MKIKVEEQIFLELPKEEELYYLYKENSSFILVNKSAQGCIFKHVIKDWEEED